MAKKNGKKWTQVGNYLLGIEKNATGGFVVCKTLSCNWSVRWREDTLMYGMMLNLIETEAAREYLHSLVTLMFVASTYPHDLVALTEKGEMPLMQGVIELVNEQAKYEASLRPQPTEEENQETIAELKQMAEIEKELNDMAAEEEQQENQEENNG